MPKDPNLVVAFGQKQLYGAPGEQLFQTPGTNLTPKSNLAKLEIKPKASRNRESLVACLGMIGCMLAL